VYAFMFLSHLRSFNMHIFIAAVPYSHIPMLPLSEIDYKLYFLLSALLILRNSFSSIYV
jgi:hypothetical protein